MKDGSLKGISDFSGVASHEIKEGGDCLSVIRPALALDVLVFAGELSSERWHSKIAKKMGVSRQTITNWISNGFVPKRYEGLLRQVAFDVIAEKESEINKLTTMLACM